MNIYDIAEEAGVSIGTVSRVLNNRGRVKQETRDRILEILKKYNYQPSAAARGLVTKSMRTIGILTVDMRVVHYANTTYTLEQEFSRRGYNVILCNTGGEMEENLRYLRMMAEKQVDGIVLIGSVFEQLAGSPDALRYLKNIPVVLANGSLPMENAYSVLVDDPLGTRLSVQHLLTKGRKKLYYIQDMDTNSAKRKAEGFCDAMCANGMSGRDRILRSEHGLEGGKAFARAFLEKHLECDGLVFGEDLTAIGAMKVLQANGVRIPEDIAIVGFNDSEYARVCTPELTSIDNKYRLVGEYSAKLMAGLLDENGEEADVLIRPILIERESS